MSDERHWSRDVASVKLNHCTFPRSTRFRRLKFHLQGIISLEDCVCGVDLYLYLHMSQYEPEVSKKTLIWFDSTHSPPRIKIIKTKFGGLLTLSFHPNVSRQLLIDSINDQLRISINRRSPGRVKQKYMTVFDIEVRNCRLSRAEIDLVGNHLDTFGRFRFLNSIFHRSYIIDETINGIRSFLFKNCSFTKQFHLDVQGVRYFSLFESTLNFINDLEYIGWGWKIRGVGNDADRELPETFFFFNSSHNIVLIQNSRIQGHSELTLELTYVNLIVSESTFNILSDQLQAGHLIEFNSVGAVNLLNTIITFTTLYYEMTSIGVMSLSAGLWNINNTQIVCPVGMKVMEIQTASSYKKLYYCQQNCDSNTYTFQTGSMVLHGQCVWKKCVSSFIYKSKMKNGLLNLPEPICKLCPVGANCSSQIKALPNYWGLRNEEDDVTMVRCPDGYCCQTVDSCDGIESCNSNRTGTLCNGCKTNFTESLFDPTCVPIKECHTGLIVTLYIFCVIAYGFGLMIMDSIRDAGVTIIKNTYRRIKQKLSKKSTTKDSRENLKKSDIKPKEDGSFKYLQILFYYVQDATLFQVNLPSKIPEETSTIVKILQFSPEVITSIYTRVSDLCFSFGTKAITKILLKSLFGPCVMLFLFFIYLIQMSLRISRMETSKFIKLLKGKLVQTFVLVVLLSYQQIVIGSFTLIKCIDIGNMKILHVQGDIECFTKWQTATEIFIYLNIIPFFFVVSHVPYYVKRKEMSVQMFILICLFPVPGLVIYNFLSTYNKRKIMSNAKDSDLEIMSNRKRSLQLKTFNANEDELSIVTEMGSVDIKISSDTLGQSIHFSDSDTDIGSEYSTDLIQVPRDKPYHPLTGPQTEHVKDIREGILHTLLEHYKTVKLFGISFTWLGVHKIYRMILVACNTYISDSLKRLTTMTGVLLCLALLNSSLKPYKNKTANTTASLSYLANCIVAIVNLVKAGLSKYGCQTNCSDVDDIVWYLDKAEEVLLIYAPLAAMSLWCLYSALQKCCCKKKEE